MSAPKQVKSATLRKGSVTVFARVLSDGTVALHARTHPDGGAFHGNGEPVEAVLSTAELGELAGLIEAAQPKPSAPVKSKAAPTDEG